MASPSRDRTQEPKHLSDIVLRGWCARFLERPATCARFTPTRATRARSSRSSTRKGRMDVTDQERQKAEELIARLEVAVGRIFPRDGGNAALITSMIQALNGLRSVLGL